jgi:hypothetical protein
MIIEFKKPYQGYKVGDVTSTHKGKVLVSRGIAKEVVLNINTLKDSVSTKETVEKLKKTKKAKK